MRRLVVVGVVFVMWCGGTRPLSAQVITGTVEGRVKDSQGGVLPGVTITAVNTGTAASFVAATTSDGLYRVPYLPPGTYDVRAELSGFRSESRQGVVVRVNDGVRRGNADGVVRGARYLRPCPGDERQQELAARSPLRLVRSN